MPISVKQILEDEESLTPVERAEKEEQQLLEARRQIQVLQDLIDELRLQGKGLEWSSEDQAWVIVDTPGINSRLVGKEWKTPDIANVFHDGIARVLTGGPLQAYPAASIANKKAWKEVSSMNEHEVIISYDQHEKSGTTSVQLRANTMGLNKQAVLDDLFAQVDKWSDLHSDHFWSMIAQLQGGQRDAGGNTWITVQRLLDYRGIQRVYDHAGRHGHRQENIRETSQIIQSMENVWIKLDEIEVLENDADKKKLKRSRISHESRLFMFGDIIYHQEMSLDGMPGRKYPIAWQYRESNWMIPFLEGPYRFTGTLLAQTLNYDPYRQFWEKRLAKYFMVYLRINAGRYRPIKIEELFTRLNLPINEERNKHRTRDRFEKAMNTMVAHEHLSSWRYQEDVNHLLAHNWLTDWLNYHIIVAPSKELQEQYQLIATRSAALRERQTSRRQSKKRGQKN